MNDKKFCFIMCTNNELYEKECLYYINTLTIPTGYEVEIITVKEASSMAAGYNEGMRKTDAKYKIYIHQDAFIIYVNLLQEILYLFQNSSIGMIGLVGITKFSKNLVVWQSERVGMTNSNAMYSADSYVFGYIENDYEEVEAIDGLIMITQYDVPWREDIFKNWDFYDMSQSMEFRLRGYKIVVPHTEEPWIIHDDGILYLKNYYNEREIFKKEYKLD